MHHLHSIGGPPETMEFGVDDTRALCGTDIGFIKDNEETTN
jgi:hypothetical protein